MKRILSLLMLLALASSGFSNVNVPDLSGTWVLDETKAYAATRLTLVKVDVEQTADSLTLTRHYRDPRNAEVTLKEVLPFDGKAFHMEYQGIPRKSSILSGEEDNAIVIEIVITMTRNNETREGITRETWKRENDVLTLTRVNPSIPDDTPLVYVYNRQK